MLAEYRHRLGRCEERPRDGPLAEARPAPGRPSAERGGRGRRGRSPPGKRPVPDVPTPSPVPEPLPTRPGPASQNELKDPDQARRHCVRFPRVAHKGRDLASAGTGAHSSPAAARTRRWRLRSAARGGGVLPPGSAAGIRRLEPEGPGGALSGGARHPGTSARARNSPLSFGGPSAAARGPHRPRDAGGRPLEAPWVERGNSDSGASDEVPTPSRCVPGLPRCPALQPSFHGAHRHLGV